MFDVVVVGAGPAGLEAARRSAELGARVALVEKGFIGGVGANDGPVPVRSLAHAARLLREAEQLERYGISWKAPEVDCGRLLERVRAVVEDVRGGTRATETLGALGVTLFDRAGASWFEDPHTIATETGRRIEAANIILCTGGHNRELPIEGREHIASHSNVWSMQQIAPLRCRSVRRSRRRRSCSCDRRRRTGSRARRRDYSRARELCTRNAHRYRRSQRR